jgi:hypothetical protein
MKWAGANCGINLIAILIGLPHGPVGVARALGIASILAILPNAILLASEATHHTRSSWFTVCFKSLLVFGLAACLAKWVGLFEGVGTNFLDSVFNTAVAAFISVGAGVVFVSAHRDCRAMILTAFKQMIKPLWK